MKPVMTICLEIGYTRQDVCCPVSGRLPYLLHRQSTYPHDIHCEPYFASTRTPTTRLIPAILKSMTSSDLIPVRLGGRIHPALPLLSHACPSNPRLGLHFIIDFPPGPSSSDPTVWSHPCQLDKPDCWRRERVVTLQPTFGI